MHMKTRNDRQLVVGLDIGTSKVTAIVGEYEPGEPITVIGIGTHVSRGMRKGMVLIATVSATAPFVGLLGTVIGIIVTFQSMAKSGSGGLGQVAGGIAEALIMTAFGLLVAIPAVWIYNYLNGRIEELQTDIDTIKAEIIDFLARPEKSHAGSKAG